MRRKSKLQLCHEEAGAQTVAREAGSCSGNWLISDLIRRCASPRSAYRRHREPRDLGLGLEIQGTELIHKMPSSCKAFIKVAIQHKYANKRAAVHFRPIPISRERRPSATRFTQQSWTAPEQAASKMSIGMPALCYCECRHERIGPCLTIG